MSIVKTLRSDIVLTKVSRLYTGPEVSGCKPVVVTFEDYKDREEVLSNASMFRSDNIHITEDMSKYCSQYCFIKMICTIVKTPPKCIICMGTVCRRRKLQESEENDGETPEEEDTCKKNSTMINLHGNNLSQGDEMNTPKSESFNLKIN